MDIHIHTYIHAYENSDSSPTLCPRAMAKFSHSPCTFQKKRHLSSPADARTVPSGLILSVLAAACAAHKKWADREKKEEEEKKNKAKRRTSEIIAQSRINEACSYLMARQQHDRRVEAGRTAHGLALQQQQQQQQQQNIQTERSAVASIAPTTHARLVLPLTSCARSPCCHSRPRCWRPPPRRPAFASSRPAAAPAPTLHRPPHAAWAPPWMLLRGWRSEEEASVCARVDRTSSHHHHHRHPCNSTSQSIAAHSKRADEVLGSGRLPASLSSSTDRRHHRHGQQQQPRHHRPSRVAVGALGAGRRGRQPRRRCL